ncbi:MAG: ligase-associated DNA damage response exonuclease [Desulfobacterales bacterium]
MPIIHSDEPLLENSDAGLRCRIGGFHIDPGRPMERAVITHAHADHARPGCGGYLATPECAHLLRARLGSDIRVQELPYGASLSLNGLRLSLHPSGHILGSAQVRLERGGEIWVITGDFKRHPDPTCAPFEPLRCHTLVTESTFGLPVFRWPEAETVMAEVRDWWRRNAGQGKTSILFAYALGKAQLVIAGVGTANGPVFTHPAVEQMARIYREAGVQLPPTRAVETTAGREDLAGALVIAPPGAEGSGWMGRFARRSLAFASGWMQIRGNRRRRALDRGFVLSDHADWPALLQTVAESRAERIWTTHGYADEVTRFLREKGLAAEALRGNRAAREADA